MDTIVSAAIKLDGVVYSVPQPGRHHNVIQLIAHKLNITCIRGEEQGFLTASGRFVLREEAGRIATESGQIDRLKWGKRLYSEDLW